MTSVSTPTSNRTATVRRTAAMNTTLDGLLDAELAFSPSFQTIYSNHLAMALVALDQLGAPSAVLEATFAAHAADESEPRDDTDRLAERLTDVRRDGIAATVRALAPTLVDAPSTALFHPLIRLAYALDVDHQGQVAAALLDWQRRHHPLPILATTVGARRAVDVAGALSSAPAGTWPRTFDLDGIARHPLLRGAVDGLAADERTLDDLSAFAIAAHLAADAFVTLHIVTGARAVRAVSSLLDDETAISFAHHALRDAAVVYAAAGAPPLLDERQVDRLRRLALPTAAEIADRAIHDTDPHVIKLANVALVEEERTDDPLYRFAAAHVVGAVPAAAAALS